MLHRVFSTDFLVNTEFLQPQTRFSRASSKDDELYTVQSNLEILYMAYNMSNFKENVDMQSNKPRTMFLLRSEEIDTTYSTIKTKNVQLQPFHPNPLGLSLRVRSTWN